MPLSLIKKLKQYFADFNLYSFLKPLLKPVKYGIKYGKGMAAVSSLHADKKTGTAVTYIGEGTGIFIIPAIYLIFNKLLTKVSKNKRLFLQLSAPVGAVVGSSFAAILSNFAIKNLPSAFDGVIGSLSGVVLTMTTLAIVQSVYKKLRKKGYFKQATVTTTTDIDDDILPAIFFDRLQAGFTMGAQFGVTVGGFFEAIHQGFGGVVSVVAENIFGVIGAVTGVIAPTVVDYFTKSKEQDQLAQNKAIIQLNFGITVGVILGTVIGGVLDQFCFHGASYIIDNIISASLGGLAGGLAAVVLPKINKNIMVASQPSTTTETQLAEQQTYLNRIQFGAKLGVTVGAGIGALAGLFIPVVGPAGGVIIGSIVGVVAMTVLTIAAPKITQKLQEKYADSKIAKTLDTCGETFNKNFKKLKMGFTLGAAAGAIIGGVVGTFGLPVVGTLAGGAIGALIGGVVGLAIAAAPIAYDYIKNKIQEKKALKQQAIDAVPLESAQQTINNKPAQSSYYTYFKSLISNKPKPAENLIVKDGMNYSHLFKKIRTMPADITEEINIVTVKQSANFSAPRMTVTIA